jgi:hypothetical protein
MMATPKINDSVLQHAVDAVAGYGNVVSAAHALGLTRGCLEGRLRSAKLRGITCRRTLDRFMDPAFAPAAVTPGGPPPQSELDKLHDEITELRAQAKALKGATVDGEYVKRKIIGLAQAATEVTAPRWLIDPVRGKALPGVPVAMWSDWHWGEVVFPDQVNGVNEFNLEVAHARARRLVERTIRLLKNHVVNPEYPGIVVNLGGDMLSGDIHEELKESNDVPLLPALLDLFGVLCWAIKTLADEFGNVFLPCVTGNHGRMSRKPQAKNRNFTNYDWLLYQLLAKHFIDDPRITFFIPDGPDALYSVFGHKILLSHGDQFRGGDGMIGAIGPITRGNQKKLARNSSINREYDTMVIGHWHQYMPLHRTMVNGSLKGYDEYANSCNFGFEPPIQALWLSHPEHGIIMHLPVYLEPHPGRTDGAPWVCWQDKT